MEPDRGQLGHLVEKSLDSVSLATLDGQPYDVNAAGRQLVGLEADGSGAVRRTRVDARDRNIRCHFTPARIPARPVLADRQRLRQVVARFGFFPRRGAHAPRVLLFGAPAEKSCVR